MIFTISIFLKKEKQVSKELLHAKGVYVAVFGIHGFHKKQVLTELLLKMSKVRASEVITEIALHMHATSLKQD